MYCAYINKTDNEFQWHFVNIAMTKWGAERAVFRYLYPKRKLVKEYTLI